MTNKKGAPKPFFKATIRDTDTLEMMVYSEIGDTYDGSGVTASDFKAQLDNNEYNRIVVRINSPGGDVFQGVAIYNLLMSQDKPVKICVDGVAASSASIVAMAGECSIGRNGMMMVHDAWTMGVGNATELRKLADTLEKVSESIAITYAVKTGKPLDDIKAMMAAETWLSAQDCIDGGFATSIAGDDDGQAMAFAKSFKSMSKYKTVPAQLKAAVCPCECEGCIAGDCTQCSNPTCTSDNCTDCPMQKGADVVVASNLSQYEARLQLLTLIQ